MKKATHVPVDHGAHDGPVGSVQSDEGSQLATTGARRGTNNVGTIRRQKAKPLNINLDKGPEGPIKKRYDAIGEGQQVISQDQIQKYLYKRYKGIGAKIYKILVAP